MMRVATNRVCAIGEAMVELAPLPSGLYQRGFAGDTFNTAWHMARALGPRGQVAFVTRLGADKVSDQFVAEMVADGLDVSAVARDPARMMGLYLIELDGVERSFLYWRGQSAARLLADDPDWLARALDGAGLIHLSGITLAILSDGARERLFAALAQARGQGARVSFDPNIRPRLWDAPDQTRAVVARFLSVSDIVLPSFDDEALLWGDADPAATLARLRAAGCGEIVVKNGAGEVAVSAGAESLTLPTPPVQAVRDTTGAGDAFNAGYLSARLLGHGPTPSVAQGQSMAAEVLRHAGARIPRDLVPVIPPG